MRTPVHLVSGAGGQDWATQARAARPAWAVCRSDGCPCCTGRVVLQVTLARLLRAARPARVLVVSAGETHADAANAVLRESPLADYVVEGRAVVLPRDAALSPGDLERIAL